MWITGFIAQFYVDKYSGPIQLTNWNKYPSAKLLVKYNLLVGLKKYLVDDEVI
jgi:hypothetical protein